MTKEINPNEIIKEALKPLARDLDKMTLIMIGVIIVLLVGFATMFVAVFGIFRDNEAEKQATFQALENQVQAQNAQIQVLTNQLRNSTVTPKSGG